jgi:thiamine kinase-like enzyme
MKKFENSKVFSHNDMLANNILIGKDEAKTIWFIDFEYCALNLRTFDIANYFNESKIDYDEKNDPFFAVDPTPVDLNLV